MIWPRYYTSSEILDFLSEQEHLRRPNLPEWLASTIFCYPSEHRTSIDSFTIGTSDVIRKVIVSTPGDWMPAIALRSKRRIVVSDEIHPTRSITYNAGSLFFPPTLVSTAARSSVDYYFLIRTKINPVYFNREAQSEDGDIPMFSWEVGFLLARHALEGSLEEVKNTLRGDL